MYPSVIVKQHVATGDQADEESMQNSEPSLNKKQLPGFLESVENLDEVDSLDECTVQEDLPDDLAASQEPVEQTVV